MSRARQVHRVPTSNISQRQKLSSHFPSKPDPRVPSIAANACGSGNSILEPQNPTKMNSPDDRGRADSFDRTKSCRRRYRWRWSKNQWWRCSASGGCRTFRMAAFALLLLLLAACSSATIVLNSGVPLTTPPPAVFPAAACPSVCFCDETNYVNCVGDDSLWEVPADLPRTVVRLELRNYAIDTLAVQGALQELLDLHEVKLQQTKIASIENGTFGNLTRLLRLDLSQNLIERITSAMFEGLSSLRYLDLSTNRVSEMDEAFLDLVNLEQLNLRDNRLPRLTIKSFPGLYKIQYLNLDSNLIASVEVGTFQYLTGLAHLIVSNNPLTALSRLDFFGSRLQYIDVSRVGLQRVPQSLTRYVRDLRLAKNNLTHVRLGDFDSYPYISLLVLDDNRIEEIEGDALGRQEYLVRLWLNGNRLQRVPANLPPGLRVLYAEENLLRALPAYSFQGLFNLEQLFLQRNLIKRIDACAFCDLLSLRHLDLQANLLESIVEGAFANLSNLISLDVSQNPLKTLPGGCFVGLDALKTLQLSRIKTAGQMEEGATAVFAPLKKLETLEVYDSPAFAAQLVNSTRALQGLRGLRELNLMHNNLVGLRSDFPHFFPQLKVVKLSGNQWNCGKKDIRWLSAWIKKTEIHFFHSYGIRCSQPAALLYKPLMMLQDSDFEVVETAKLVPISSAIVDGNVSSVGLPVHATAGTVVSTTAAAPTPEVSSSKLAVITRSKANISERVIVGNTTNNATSQLKWNINYNSDTLPPVGANESSLDNGNASSSGLDFVNENLEGDYDEMDLFVEWTSSSASPYLTEDELELTAAPSSTTETAAALAPATLPDTAVVAATLSRTEISATPTVGTLQPNSTSLPTTSDPTTTTTIPTSPTSSSTEVATIAVAAKIVQQSWDNNDTITISNTTNRSDETSSTKHALEAATPTIMDTAISAPPTSPDINFSSQAPRDPNRNQSAIPRLEFNASTQEHIATTQNESGHLTFVPIHVLTNCTLAVSEAPSNSVLVAAVSVAAGIALLLLGLALCFQLFRWRRKYWPVSSTSNSPSSYSICSTSAGSGGTGSNGGLSGLINRHMRRSSSSSISYSPQRDEVSIVTVSEGTVGLRTLTHQGLSNKLYFVLENGTDPAASSDDAIVNKVALPDSSLHELLPSPRATRSPSIGDGIHAGDPLLYPLYAHPHRQQRSQNSHHPPHKWKSASTKRGTSCFSN